MKARLADSAIEARGWGVVALCALVSVGVASQLLKASLSPAVSLLVSLVVGLVCLGFGEYFLVLQAGQRESKTALLSDRAGLSGQHHLAAGTSEEAIDIYKERFTIEIRSGDGDVEERFEHVSLNPRDPRFVERVINQGRPASRLVRVVVEPEDTETHAIPPSERQTQATTLQPLSSTM